MAHIDTKHIPDRRLLEVMLFFFYPRDVAPDAEG